MRVRSFIHDLFPISNTPITYKVNGKLIIRSPSCFSVLDKTTLFQLRNEINYFNGEIELNVNHIKEPYVYKHDASLNLSDFTIVVGFKRSGTPNSDEDIVAKNDATLNNDANYLVSLGANGKIKFMIEDSLGNNELLESTNTYNNGNWHVAICRKTNLGDLKLDTDLESKTLLGSLTPSNNNLPLTLGADSGNSNTRVFNGEINIVAIYNRVLNDTEVADIKNDFNFASSGLVFFFNGNEPYTSLPSDMGTTILLTIIED